MKKIFLISILLLVFSCSEDSETQEIELSDNIISDFFDREDTENGIISNMWTVSKDKEDILKIKDNELSITKNISTETIAFWYKQEVYEKNFLERFKFSIKEGEKDSNVVINFVGGIMGDSKLTFTAGIKNNYLKIYADSSKTDSNFISFNKNEDYFLELLVKDSLMKLFLKKDNSLISNLEYKFFNAETNALGITIKNIDTTLNLKIDDFEVKRINNKN
ncbi:MAG: hypothetical protein B6I24_03085 [Bacteroidetes bacterium 4572_128]|nr:MAG: hypothetical protein B6I24_03085 [Bacteroidetes bacterium 4572_128]